MHRSGISGEVDNRTWEKYGQTFTMAILGGVAMLGASKIPSDDVGSLAQYTALNIVDMATEVLDKQVDLAPVVIIPSATRIILKPKVDINLTSKTSQKSKESK
jgi:type IV secretory pathway VirB10-like protein